jgi:enoyl-CoA hydratase/carnithine racemase
MKKESRFIMDINYEKEGRIAIFTINRPKVRNAINEQVMQELHDHMVAFRDDPELWVGIVTGAGEKAFCAGADINELRGKDLLDVEKMPTVPYRGLDVWKPLIAAINGYAMGGGFELALSCDIRIASENARMGLPEVTIGLIPGQGGTSRLPRLIPMCKAAEIILMGKLVDAEEAYRIGLVNKVVPQEQLMPTAREWAEQICRAAPLAVRAAKESIVKTMSSTLEEGLRMEKWFLRYLQKTDDYIEGTNAFLEKRKPNFKGS